MHTHKHAITLSLTTLLAIFFTLVGLAAAAVNTAPTLDNSGAPYFDPIFQDDSDSAGTLVSAMLATGAGGDPISDPDSDGEGIAVVAVDNANGAWQFSTDNGSNWTNFPTSTFAASLDLSTLASGGGLTINGSSVDDQAGWSVANAGDVDGDGFDDIVIGANQADPGGKSNAGAGYVIFGTNQISATLDVASLDGSNGFVLAGAAAGDYAGKAVSSAGDLNNDGFDDVIISAPDRQDGTVYVVFGHSRPFSTSLDLATLDGSNGFVLNGGVTDGKAGYSVSEAGDVNGDNIDDIIIGAFQASQSYVIFGSGSGFPASLDLSSLGSSGFTINGKAQSDWAGWSVSGTGDVDGDGYDDLLVGATDADPNGVDAAGEAYLLFGQSSFPATFNLSSLDGSSGMTLQGAATWDKAGWSVSGAGDLNGDGYDDVIIGAAQADNVLTDTGKSYVVFGHSRPFSATLALSALDGSNGFVLDGSGAGDFSGQSVSGAGDLNGDGLADLIVGANKADPNGINDAGESYLIFGSRDPFPAALDLSGLDGLNGYVINGAANNDQAGYAVGGGGDFDGDGLADLIIGAPHSSAAAANGGRAFVVFSRPSVTTLHDTAKIRFVPNAGFTGSARLLFRAWDTTGGPNNGDTNVQVTGTGGSFPYSSALEQATITVLPPPPDLALQQSVQPASGSVLPGQTITYTLTFSNSGAATAHDVVLTDTIPAALGNLSVTNSGVPITSTGSQNYVWQIGDLPVGSGGTITITAEISPDLAADTSFTNAATLAGSDLEANTANNSASKTTSVALPRVYFESANFSVAEVGDTAVITARLNIASSLSVAVDYATSDGTASAGSDYSAASGVLTFSPYTKVQTFSVSILDDWLDEPDETIDLTLSNPSRAVLSTLNQHTPYQATLTINNDDQTITGLQASSSSPTALGSSTAFTATVSAGNDVTYAWDFGDGATGSGANAAHTYSAAGSGAAAGSYTALVTATNAVNQVTATTSVTIREAVAGLAASNNGPVQLGQAATMTATISAGSDVSYSWDFGDGSGPVSGANAVHTYATVGSHIATVTASNGVSSQTAQTTIVVNDVPLAGLQASNNGPKPMNQAVTLNATLTAGSNVTYSWDFGDGTTGSGPVAVHTYPQTVGVYTATVTASNSLGSLAKTTVVSITDIPITGLTVSSNSPRILGQPVDLTATISAGSNVSYVWDLDDGTQIAVSGSSVAGYLYAAPGSYNVTVTATNGVDSDVATVLVTISPRTCWVRLNNDPTDYFYVQDAVDASTSPTDVVKVAGTCTGVSEIAALNVGNSFKAKQIVALTTDLTLRGGYTVTNWSSYDPAANPTTLDAQGQGRVIYITNSAAPVIEGLRLIGGNAAGLGGSSNGDVGGGVFVDQASPTLRYNDISHNSAKQGGGLWLLQSAAVISQNTISNNTVTGTAADGAGLYLYQDASTIISNTVSSNDAGRWGGGAYIYQGQSLFRGNTVSGNQAQAGAGLYMFNSTAMLEENTITTNTAAGSGGGLYLFDNAAAISKNSFHGNTAASGGGLYLYSDQTSLDGNTVTANSATTGGGFYLNKSDATLANTFVIDNQANSYGSGLYILGAQPKIYHATIASNKNGDGIGLYVGGTAKSNVQIKNSILVDHLTGLHVEATNQASLEATLWGSGSWANSSDWTGSGTVSNGSINIWTDPGFANPAGGDYHLAQGSAALDEGVATGVATDFDGEPRFLGGQPDLGADELPRPLNVLHTAAPNPAAPGTELTYTLLVTNATGSSMPVTIVFTPPAGVTPNSARTWNTSLTADGLWSTQLTSTVASGTGGGPQVSSLQVTDSDDQVITNRFSLDVQNPISGLTLSNDGPTPLGDVTTMSASATGDSIGYAWNLGDGTMGSGPAVTHTYAAAGSYTVVVTASNGVGYAVDSMTVLVEKKVSGLNVAYSSPVARDQATALSATTSQGSSVAYAWDFGDGATGSGASVNPTYAAIGAYTVVVTASNQVSLVTKTISIEVQEAIGGLLAANDGPTELNQTTTLSATISAGNKVSYDWDFGDGTQIGGSGPTVSHQYGAVGSYVATVTASNGVSNQTAQTTVVVTDIPISGLAATNNGPTIFGAATTLQASISAGSNVSYVWDFGDGTQIAGSGATVNHTYSNLGSYTAVVTASNSASTQSTATTVTVVDQPISGLSFSSSSPDNLGETTTFNASTTAGTNVVYTWTFGDGNSGSGKNTSHTYSAGGSYPVTLTAANSAYSATTSGLVTINHPPLAVLSLSAYTGTLDTPITADASGSSDPEGSSLTYTFDFGGQKTVGPQSSPMASHTFSGGGTFTIQVTVSDGQLSSSASQTVDIKRIPKLAIDKQGPARAYVGDLITYTLVVTNMTLPPGSTPDAILQVSPTTLNFSATEGGSNPASQSFSISNGGTGSLAWLVRESASWLTLSSTGGSGPASVSALVDISGLSRGVYNEKIIVDAGQAQNGRQEIDATLTLFCTGRQPVDVVLALDRSGSMYGSPFTTAQAAVKQFIGLMDLSGDQVGLVSFNGLATVDQTLTQDGAAVQATVDGLYASGMTDIAEAISDAHSELVSSRRKSDNTPVIILLSDGTQTVTGDPLLEAAQAKADGIRIISIGLGYANTSILQSVASAPGDYYYAPSAGDLSLIYNRIAVEVGCPGSAASLSLQQAGGEKIDPFAPVFRTFASASPAETDTATAYNLVISDTIPAGATYVAGGTRRQGNVVYWDITEPLSANTSVQVSFVVAATGAVDPIVNDDYAARADGGYSAAGAKPVTTLIDIPPVPDISLTLQASDTSVEGTQTVIYSYLVKNTGTATLTNIALTDSQLGLIGGVETLLPGETLPLQESAVIIARTTNVATVTADSVFGAVSDSQSVTVDFVPVVPCGATIQSVGDGDWKDASTWSPARIPTNSDIVLVNDGHTVIIQASARTNIQALCNYGVLRSTEKQQLHINTDDFLFNYGTIESTDGTGGSGKTCGQPANDLKLDGRPITNWGTIQAGNGGDGDKCGGRGGSVMVRGLNTTNTGTICAGKGGNVLDTAKNQSHGGKGGNTSVWGNHGGPGMLFNTGLICAGDGGHSNLASDDKQQGGDGGDLRLISEPDVLLSGGRYYAGDGGQGTGGGDDGKDGRVFIEPTIIQLAGPNTEVKGGDVIIFGGDGTVLDLSNMNGAAIKASGDITLAVGSGGKVDLKHNGAGSDVLQAGGQVHVAADTVETDSGTSLSEVVGGPVTKVPAKIIRDVSLNAPPLVEGLPGATLPISLTVLNGGPDNDSYTLSQQSSSSGWTISNLPSSVDIDGLDTRDLGLAIAVPAAAQGGEQNVITFTATSTSDPNLVTTAVVQVDVAGTGGGGGGGPSGSIFLPIVIK